MSVAKTVNENVNSRTVQLVKLLAEVGPDIPEISRRLGQFKESVRYRYKEKIISKGFAVQAMADNERLGLRRIMIMVEFSEPYKAYTQAILSSMNELCYLVSFAKELVGSRYTAMLAVPRGFEEKTIEFFMGLKEKGMFTSVEPLTFEWHRIVPMKAEFYDFDTGRWDFQWADPSADAKAAAYAPSEPAKFDYADLLILKELQMDANKSLKEVADKLEINYKKLAWHYNAHVKGRNLIRGYNINWMGTRYDYVLEKALHRKHRYLGLDLVARGVTEYETMALREQLGRIPFVVSESVGTNYFARLMLPVDFVVEGFQFLGKLTDIVKGKISLYPMDQTDAIAFTVSYQLYDQARKCWTLNEVELAKRFEQLIMEIKERS